MAGPPAGNEVPLGRALELLQAEIERLARISAGAEAAAALFDLSADPRLQNLDALTQSLSGLKTFLSALTEAIEAGGTVTLEQLTDGVRPNDLARRLAGTPGDGTGGEVELF